MGTKRAFLAVTEATKDGQYFSSYVLAVPAGDNIVSVLNRRGIITANICATRKAAEETAAFWNECHKRNGAYMYSPEGG